MTEKELKERFEKFLGENDISEDAKLSEKDFLEMAETFILNNPDISPEDFKPDITPETAETAADFLGLSDYANNQKDALKYAKKALELEPDNFDASVQIVDLSSKTCEKRVENFEKEVTRATKIMKEQGWFEKENIGMFWLIYETRPYMRLRHSYIESLTMCNMLRKAVAECEELLKLCRGDNLGIRYHLMPLYAALEEKEAAEELYNKYDEDSTLFLLPLSILYYRLGDFKKSASYLKKIKSMNSGTMEFYRKISKSDIFDLLEKYGDDVQFGYKSGSIEEFIEAFRLSSFLIAQSSSYFEWAYKKLKTIKIK